MLSLFFVLLCIGIIVGLVTTRIPMDPTIKGIVIILGVVLALAYVGSALGLINGLPPAYRLR